MSRNLLPLEFPRFCRLPIHGLCEMTQSRHISRRSLLQAGAIGSLGLSLPQLARLQAEEANLNAGGQAKYILFIFLSGGLSQLDSFDMKPEGPSAYRGEFRPGTCLLYTSPSPRD